MVCIVNSLQNYSGLRLRLSHHHQNWLISIMCITIKLFYICWSEMKYETYFCAHVFSICYQIDLCISWFWVLRKHFECTSYSLEFVQVLQKYLYVQVDLKTFLSSAKNICMDKLISRIHPEHKYSLESFTSISPDCTPITLPSSINFYVF